MKKNKFLNLMLVFAMVVTLILPAGTPACAASNPPGFIFDVSEGNITIAAGSGSNIKVTYGAAQTTTADFVNTQEITIIGSTTTNVVVVNGVTANITLNGASIKPASGCAFALTNSANVTLTLIGTGTDGNFLNSTDGNAGLQVSDGQSVTIQGAGSLTATGSTNSAGGNGHSGAGIGGSDTQSGGSITILSGAVTANGGKDSTSFNAAGIGGGSGGAGGNISIQGGTIVATAGADGAGIGGGDEGVGSTAIDISGGNVTADSTRGRGAAIGGANGENNGSITISNGIINAKSAIGAGIGGGNQGNGGTINISGGTITANSSYGAGIGGGSQGNGGTINISGGTVTAMCAMWGAGIGAGYNGTGGNIDINSSAVVMAASKGTGFPAISSASGSGSVINAKLNNAISTTADSYLKCNGNVLKLPANDTCFAFSTAAASQVKAYSDSACNTFITDIVTPAGAANIPISTNIYDPPTSVTIRVTYPLTVNLNGGNGSTGNGSYPSGSAVAIDAGTRGGYTFSGWTSSNGGAFANANSTSTTFTMPGNATTITANWTQDTYALTVNLDGGSGSTTSGSYALGAAVSIDAGTKSGCTFNSWTSSNGGTFNDASSAATTFTMPGNATTITATWTPTVTTYALTVSLDGGSGSTTSGTYTSGATIAIDAGAKSGYTFNGWTTSSGGTFTDVSSSATTFTMPGNATTITANWTQNTVYPLTVNLNGGNGATGNGSYTSGATVAIDAGTKSGYTFSGWTSSNGGTFANSSSAATTFTMPGNATTITASWTQDGSDEGGGGSYIQSANNTNNTIVIVDNNDYSIGTENKDGSSTTATVDQSKLTEDIAKASDSSSTIFPVSANTNVTAQLVVKNIEDMAKKDMTLTVQTGNVSYNLNTASINTAKITASLGTTASEHIPFNVSIANSNAMVNGTTVVVSPVEFAITATYNGKIVDVDTFNSFVDRTIEITAEQAKKITTAVVVGPNGSLRHVPTKVTIIDGKYYAVINSLTNSTYTVIWHPMGFNDVADHWAKTEVNDMGSRMVVTGVGNNNFAPDRDITRAEFAAIVVRALGLAPGTGKNGFSDVEASKWYCGYIETASEYGIIQGYNKTSFGPNDVITREQAMTMIARAMRITGLKSEIKDSEISSLLANYSDQTAASDYARTSIAACLKTGIITGRSSNTIAPKNCISRAEVAVIVQRLLQKSDLI
ncbi:MAG: InlB B-repeat-containing protein [Candidatus Saccharibacteria bacterium]